MYSSELFNKLSQVKFKPCELDKVKIDQYLDQVKSKQYIEQILSLTQRIPTETLCQQLRQMVKLYLSNSSNIKPNYVFLPVKIGSEQYFFSQVYDLFPEITIENIINETTVLESAEEINVLIVDDASFSGTNTLSKIDELSYCNTKTKFNFIIAIPCQITPLDIAIRKLNLPPEQSDRLTIINIPGYITPPTIKLDNYDLGNESLRVSTCFFDHKVPNEFGSWPQIYLKGDLFKNGEKFGSLFVDNQNPTKEPILQVFLEMKKKTCKCIECSRKTI